MEELLDNLRNCSSLRYSYGYTNIQDTLKKDDIQKQFKIDQRYLNCFIEFDCIDILKKLIEIREDSLYWKLKFIINELIKEDNLKILFYLDRKYPDLTVELFKELSETDNYLDCCYNENYSTFFKYLIQNKLYDLLDKVTKYCIDYEYEYGSNYYSSYSSETKPLFIALSMKDFKAFDIMIKNGYSLKYHSRNKHSLMTYAVSKCDKEALNFLIENKYYIDTPGLSGLTPFFRANLEQKKILLELNEELMIYQDCRKGNKHNDENIDVIRRSKYLKIPVIYYSYQGDVNVLKLILEYSTKHLNEALIYAIVNNKIECAQMLLDYDAELVFNESLKQDVRNNLDKSLYVNDETKNFLETNNMLEEYRKYY